MGSVQLVVQHMIKLNVTDYIDIDVERDLSGYALRIITSSENEPASQVYVNSKKKLAEKYGMNVEIIHDPTNFQRRYFEDVDIEIVQYPTSESLTKYSITSVSFANDIDGLTLESSARLYKARRYADLNDVYVPCTAFGVSELITRVRPDRNQKIAIIGRSDLVGKPLLQVLNCHGYRVESFDSRSDLTLVQDVFDIIVLATGTKADLDFIENCIDSHGLIIDVGIIRDENGLHGDLYPLQISALNDKQQFDNVFYTPVPGGVGRLTTWSIFEQLALKNIARRNT